MADEVVVASKCGAGRLQPGRPLAMEPPTNFEDLAADVVRRQLAISLENLGLPQVGVCYGHVDDRNRLVTEIADPSLSYDSDCSGVSTSGLPTHA